MPVSRSKRAVEELAIAEKVLSCPLVCLCSLCGLLNDNGITFTPVQPISKLSAVTDGPLPLTITCGSTCKHRANFLFSLVSHVRLKRFHCLFVLLDADDGATVHAVTLLLFC